MEQARLAVFIRQYVETQEGSPAAPYSEAHMCLTPASASRAMGAVLTTLLGVGFFFVIIGVFGLLAAIIGLLLFISLAILILRRPQAEGTRP